MGKVQVLLQRCHNHNMINTEKMQNFIKGIIIQTRMLLDASTSGTIRVLTEVQVNELIEKMILNEYHSPSERGVKFIETSSTP